MKKLLFILTMLFLPVVVSAQAIEESAVPDSVKAVFNTQYNTVTSVRWQKERSGDYEVNFRVNGNKNSATYSPSGEVLETEMEISTNALPKAALEYVSKNYPDQEIEDAFKITLKNGTVRYEVEIGEKELFFDTSGKITK